MGCLMLPFRLARFRKVICVYLYNQGDVIDLWTLSVCRILKIPVAQECCEWWPGTKSETRFRRWMYNHIMFRLSSGALPISTLIESRIQRVVRPEYPLLRVPVLVDADEVRREEAHFPTTPGVTQPYLFWCGMLDGYKRDPLFLVRVLDKLKRNFAIQLGLILGGPCGDQVRKEILNAAKVLGIESQQIIITGFIPESELFRLATHASVALLPLWDDDRSKSRFPTKLGLYAAAGRPIVSSPIGEIPHFLQDGKRTFAPPGDEQAWAQVIARLINDKKLYSRISEKMEKILLPRVEYRNVGVTLRKWFMELPKCVNPQHAI